MKKTEYRMLLEKIAEIENWSLFRANAVVMEFLRQGLVSTKEQAAQEVLTWICGGAK